jgi:pSer/pThr/pTyr-binding forkhead associated (FHA) protein
MDKTIPVHPVARLRQPEGGEFLLYPGRTVRLGRSAENDVVLNDPKISRFHAALDWTGSGFAIRDLGSINGTRVNHETVTGQHQPHPA